MLFFSLAPLVLVLLAIVGVVFRTIRQALGANSRYR
jgi:hypothetical protein